MSARKRRYRAERLRRQVCPHASLETPFEAKLIQAAGLRGAERERFVRDCEAMRLAPEWSLARRKD